MSVFKVLLYENMDERGVEYLRQHAEVVFASGLEEHDLVRQVADVDAIVVRANGVTSRRVIEAAPKLKVIGRHGVGLDTIDVEAATDNGVYVVNTPHATTEAVAEHTVGMLLVLAKEMFQADRAFRAGHWDARKEHIGFELKGRILGIVGMGRIGYRVAEICHAIGMKILYTDALANQSAEETLGARKVDLVELLRSSDAVTLHVPLMPATRHMIGAPELEMMKPTALLINAARGAVVNNDALLQALQTSRIAGAGLDVFEAEPLPADSPFLKLDNVVVTPHMASHTADAMYGMAMVAEDVVAVLQEREPKYAVNNPKQT